MENFVQQKLCFVKLNLFSSSESNPSITRHRKAARAARIFEKASFAVDEACSNDASNGDVVLQQLPLVIFTDFPLLAENVNARTVYLHVFEGRTKKNASFTITVGQ